MAWLKKGVWERMRTLPKSREEKEQQFRGINHYLRRRLRVKKAAVRLVQRSLHKVEMTEGKSLDMQSSKISQCFETNAGLRLRFRARDSLPDGARLMHLVRHCEKLFATKQSHLDYPDEIGLLRSSREELGSLLRFPRNDDA